MGIKAVILLNEAGLPICRCIMDLKNKPVESLIAAIIGLANELDAGDVSHAEFEKLSMIFVRGCVNKALILTLITDKVSYLYYLYGIYLLNKLERALPENVDVVSRSMEAAAREILVELIPLLERIPDFLAESFQKVGSLFGPMMYSSLMLLLYRKFNMDPLIIFVKDPKKFYKELKNIVGDSAIFLVRYVSRYLVEEYGLRTSPDEIADWFFKIISLDELDAVKKFRDLIEVVIDDLIEKEMSLEY